MSDRVSPRQPFLLRQTLLMLEDTHDPWRHLQPEMFRAGRLSGGGSGAGTAAGEGTGEPVWRPLARDELVADLCRIDSPLRRLVITTDGGLGKSANLEWLRFAINSQSSSHVAVLLKLNDLQERKSSDLEQLLAAELVKHSHHPQADHMRMLELVERGRRRGQLVLLLDQLDHVGDDSPAEALLKNLLEDPKWEHAPIVVAGRPYSLEKLKPQAIPGVEWRFVQIEEFSPELQEVFLGSERYRQITEEPEVRQLLGVPRVLHYLKELSLEDAKKIRTPSDVYFWSLRHLIKEGLNTEAARGLRYFGKIPPSSVPQFQIDFAFKMFAAIAWEMLWTPATGVADGDAAAAPGRRRTPSKSAAKAEIPAVNFDKIAGAAAIDDFKQRVFTRLNPKSRNRWPDAEFEHDFHCLEKMNQLLEHGLIDAERFAPILWRNNSLHEFFAAYWLAWEADETDAKRLRPAVPIRGEPATEKFYWIWRFLVEMPDDAVKPAAWSTAVATLYRRRADTVVDESKPAAKLRRGRSEDDVDELPYRSTEMIYRSWHRLEAYAKAGHKPAKAAFNGFLGEFSRILDGKQGPLRRNAAQGFVDSFVQIPASNFQYGPSAAESTLSAKEIAEGNRLWNLLQDASERARIVNEQYPNAHDRHTRSLKGQYENTLLDYSRCNNGEELMKKRLRKEDFTETNRKRSIPTFQMSRYPTLNAWYRLFDPTHGMRTADIVGGYPRISGDNAQPAIFISYFDAWVYCRWAHWGGKSCRLPFEDEWECACKACDFCAAPGDQSSGCRCDWIYWWDKYEFEENRCTANQDYRTGATTSPAAFDDDGPNGHRNGWNLVDMLGNVWEWCELKRDPKVRGAESSDLPDYSARVLRGASWDNRPPDVLRSFIRSDNLPFDCNDVTGFRVCRC